MKALLLGILDGLGLGAAVLGGALLLVGCSDPDRTLRTLDAAGFTEIRISRAGWVINNCKDSDDFATHFEALGPTGKPVSGDVCSSYGGGATVRFD